MVLTNKTMILSMIFVVNLLVSTAQGKLYDPTTSEATTPARNLQGVGIADDIDNPNTESHLLGNCQGDCDYNHQCAGDLICYQRNRGDPVPCCPHIGTGGRTDFCAPAGCNHPSPTTSKPTASPTKKPTASPTKKPTGTATPAPTQAPVLPPVDIDIDVCFSADSTMTVLGKGSVVMKDINLGDKVLVSNHKYEPVYAFAHYSPSTKAEFLVFHTKDGQKLEITANHMLYKDEEDLPVLASSVRVGDKLVTLEGSNTVTKVSRTTKTGLYAPLTASGTLLVNGIQASSYTAVLPDTDGYLTLRDGSKVVSMQEGIHLFLAPMRLYCRAAVATRGSLACASHTENGLLPYVDHGITFLHWLNGQGIVVQMIMIAGMFPLFYFAMALESLLFGSLSLLLLAAGLAWEIKTILSRRSSGAGKVAKQSSTGH